MAKLLNGTNVRGLQANREKLDMLELYVTARQQISVYANTDKKYLLARTPTFGKVGVQFFFRSLRS